MALSKKQKSVAEAIKGKAQALMMMKKYLIPRTQRGKEKRTRHTRSHQVQVVALAVLHLQHLLSL